MLFVIVIVMCYLVVLKQYVVFCSLQHFDTCRFTGTIIAASLHCAVVTNVCQIVVSA